MAMIDGLLLGIHTAFSPTVLFYCLMGVTVGTFIGVLPGIGALATVSLLLPVSFHLDPASAIVMLAGVYYGAQYGGSTASILLNLPGTPSHAVTCLDGYPLARKGKAGVALFLTTIASFVGSMIGVVALAAFAPAIAEIGLSFGAWEYFSMMLLGLIAASTMTSGSKAKGLAMVVVGLFLGTIGTDTSTGINRFVFGVPGLLDGINLIALAMGIFGVNEIIATANHTRISSPERISLRGMLPNREETRRSVFSMLRGTGVGGFFGVLPGAGPSIAAFMAYAVERNISSTPERFGKGAVEGLVSPEAANNAAVQTAFIPTLSLGIPGDAVMALMLTALIIHGIQPGPMMLTMQPEVFWGLVVSFVIGNVMLVVLNIPLIGVWVSILRIPYVLLFPAMLVCIALGVYSVNNSTFDVMLVALIGGAGYLIYVLRFEATPMLLGFVLGPMMEENLRRALQISRGDPTTFVTRPVSGIFLALCAALLVWTIWGGVRGWRHRMKEKRAEVA